MAAGLFLVLVVWFSRDRVEEAPGIDMAWPTPALQGWDAHASAGGKGSWLGLARDYARTAMPIYVGFVLLDRLYQWARFGSWTNTYVTIFAREERQIDPTLPLKYPFSGHFFQGGLTAGMIGPFFAPEKSVFLFDPLFGLTGAGGSPLLETILDAGSGLPGDWTDAGAGVPPVYMLAIFPGLGILRGVTAMHRAPSNSVRCSPGRCCCDAGRHWAGESRPWRLR